MTSVDTAQQAVSAAEVKHASATQRAACAAERLETAEVALGDHETTGTIAAWRSATEERELARVAVEGAFRRLGTARQELDSAEMAAAHETIERLTPMIDRVAIFGRLNHAILTLARPVPTDADDVDFAADAVARRDASRAIDSALAEHAAAVEAVTSAHVRLAQAAPRLVPVTRSQVDAAVEIERIATSEPDRNAAAARCQFAIKPRTPLLHLGPGDVATICERARTELVSGDCYR